MNGQTISINIGEAIQKGRERKRWSQKELAEFMEVDTSLVSKWENHKALPTSEDLIKLAIELDVVHLLFPGYTKQKISGSQEKEMSQDMEEEIKNLRISDQKIWQNIHLLEDSLKQIKEQIVN